MDRFFIGALADQFIVLFLPAKGGEQIQQPKQSRPPVLGQLLRDSAMVFWVHGLQKTRFAT
jgi:hypothetical protein